MHSKNAVVITTSVAVIVAVSYVISLGTPGNAQQSADDPDGPSSIVCCVNELGFCTAVGGERCPQGTKRIDCPCEVPDPPS